MQYIMKKVCIKKIPLLLFILVVIVSCGKTYEEKKQITKAEKTRLLKQDSLALKVAVMPTIDCLPFYIAKECRLFDTLKVDVSLKLFNSQIECDQALLKRSVEGSISDRIRVERMSDKGLSFTKFSNTGTYWLLIANRMARIKRLNQLGDKMVAMTRFSATDYLTDKALTGVKTSSQVFKIQINDVNIRLSMLLNNEMDAVWATEPYATEAKLKNNPVLCDSRDIDKNLGEIVFLTKSISNVRRKKQYTLFTKAYNMACDSLNKKGLKNYSGVIKKYYKVSDACINSLPKIKFVKSKI